MVSWDSGHSHMNLGHQAPRAARTLGLEDQQIDGSVCECMCVYTHDSNTVVEVMDFGRLEKLPVAKAPKFCMSLTTGGNFVKQGLTHFA